MERTENELEGGAAPSGRGAPTIESKTHPGLIARFASVRLTLWVLGFLAIAMAVATIIPQKAASEAYERVLGVYLGKLIANTALRNIYGAWWFTGAFVLLALNLGACTLQRVGRLLRHKPRQRNITREEVLARSHHARWIVRMDINETAAALTKQLGKQKYLVEPVPAQEGERGIFGQRGRLVLWAPVLAHVGMVLILIGAAWGRFPNNTRVEVKEGISSSSTSRAMAPLLPGGSTEIRAGDETFSLRLLDAGAEHDAEGKPTEYWANAEILKDGTVIKSHTVRPNSPIRYHGVSIVLYSLLPSGYEVEVTKGQKSAQVPVVFNSDGSVNMMQTITRLESPPWVVFIHEFQRMHGKEGDKLAAKVYTDRSGHLSPNWELVGWVGEDGLDFDGVHFQLTSAGGGAQFSLDRDIGIPVVWAGFIMITLGTLLALGATRRSVIALVTTKGRKSQVLIGVSGVGAAKDLDHLFVSLPKEMGIEIGKDESGKDDGEK